MDPGLYRAATKGNVGYLGSFRGDDVVLQRTPKGNNVLHIAAEFKKINFFRHLSKDSHLARYRPLFWGTNNKADTPLHLAARVGCPKVVKFLIEHSKKEPHVDEESGPPAADDDDDEADHYKRLLRMRNWQGDTALHLAARYGHRRVLTRLMEADPNLCCLTNNANESPLFIAIRQGFVRMALSIVTDSPISPSYEGTDYATALHAAVTRKSINTTRLVKIIVSKKPDLIKDVDKFGWTPLHYAALRGHLAATKILIKVDGFAAYNLDKSGMSALHVAAFEGRTKVMKVMIRDRPDTCDLHNHKGQTILHAAVLGGQSNVVKYILKTRELARLINDADEDGNTPLHLAVIHKHKKIVRILVGNRGVDKTLVNKDRLKPVDIILSNSSVDMFLGNSSERDTLMLPRVEAPYFREQILYEFMELESRENDTSNTPASADNRQKIKTSSSNNDSKIFDTNLLVSILIATVTFTAVFDIPEESVSKSTTVFFKSDLEYTVTVKSDSEHTAAFYVFLIFDALSFCISIFSVFLNFTAATFFGGHRYARSSLIQCSIVGMIIAFASATFLQLDRPKENSLGIAISVICALLCVYIIFTLKSVPSKQTRKMQLRRTRLF